MRGLRHNHYVYFSYFHEARQLTDIHKSLSFHNDLTEIDYKKEKIK